MTEEQKITALSIAQKQYFLFDMDGTLVDSTWLWETYLSTFLARYRVSADTATQRQFDTLPLRESAEYIAKRYALSMNGMQMFSLWSAEIEATYRNKLKLKSGAQRYLQFLKNSGKKLVLATANHENLALACLENNQVLHLFDAIFCGDHTEIDKSDPAFYLQAMAQIGAETEKTLLFEDTLSAVLTAEKIPLDTVVIEDQASIKNQSKLIEHALLYVRDFQSSILYQ